MRLRRVRIERFWDDDDIVVDFRSRRNDEELPRLSLAVLVGPNGVGKSRLLEYLGRIFRCLAEGVRAELDYELEYECRDSQILVCTRQPDLGVPERISGRRIDALGAWLLIAPRGQAGWDVEALQDRLPSDPQTWLPVVVGVSSGPTSRLDRAINPRYDPLTGDQRDPVALGDPPAPAARAVLDQPRCIALSALELRLAVLALLSHPRLSGTGPAWSSIQEAVGLRGDSALLGFSVEVDERFDKMLAPRDADRLDQLIHRASRIVTLAPQQLVAGTDPDEPNIRAVFDSGPDLSHTIGELSEDAVVWFHDLLRWQRRGAIKDVHLVLRRVGQSSVLLDEELSDGQFLLIGRYALLTLLSNEGNVLMLMDEPETHFNDRWKAQLIYQLARTLGRGRDDDNVVIATHSELTLTDAGRDDVFVISGREVHTAPISTFAADRDVITGSLVGADVATGALSQHLVDQAIQSGTEDAIAKLLDRTGPGYQRFRLRYALNQLANNAP